MKKFYTSLSRDYDKVKPLCPIKGCGGCQFQEYSLDDQRDMKVRFARYILGYEYESLIDDIITVGPPIGYRTRMDFVTAFGKIGMRQKGNYRKVIDIPRCLLMSEKMNDVYSKARDLILNQNVEMYDYINHNGYLRYLVLRSAVDSDGNEQVMLIVTTKNDNTFISL